MFSFALISSSLQDEGYFLEIWFTCFNCILCMVDSHLFTGLTLLIHAHFHHSSHGTTHTLDVHRLLLFSNLYPGLLAPGVVYLLKKDSILFVFLLFVYGYVCSFLMYWQNFEVFLFAFRCEVHLLHLLYMCKKWHEQYRSSFCCCLILVARIAMHK